MHLSAHVGAIPDAELGDFAWPCSEGSFRPEEEVRIVVCRGCRQLLPWPSA